mmetsp:Transcript_1388/g.4476  ORF Transcript_1388/g.4476 Transcript_1388/m.4476 type:complete len:216 (-) Transcript_1388:188-835(-)
MRRPGLAACHRKSSTLAFATITPATGDAPQQSRIIATSFSESPATSTRSLVAPNTDIRWAVLQPLPAAVGVTSTNILQPFLRVVVGAPLGDTTNPSPSTPSCSMRRRDAAKHSSAVSARSTRLALVRLSSSSTSTATPSSAKAKAASSALGSGCPEASIALSRFASHSVSSTAADHSRRGKYTILVPNSHAQASGHGSLPVFMSLVTDESERAVL